MGSAKDPITIGILSLVYDEAIDTQLIPMLKTPSTNLRFVQLKPADLNKFSPPGDLHAVILLHPFKEGRLSLTDVTDARYSKLLPKLSSRFGSHGVCVIAYLIQNLKESTEQTHMEMVKHNQPTVFLNASCVILCGKLEDLFQENIQKIREFLKDNWKTNRESQWQDEWIINTPAEEDKQIQNPKSTEEEIHRKTTSAKDKVINPDDKAGNTSLLTRSSKMEDETKEPPPVINPDDKAGKTSLSTRSSKMKDEIREPPPVVLVTDASGFIGSHIVKQLTHGGYKVRGALDLEKGTLESFEKGTLDNEKIQRKVGMLKGLFPKLDLYEAGICHCYGWKKAVTGCSHVIHTSRFQDDKPPKEDDVAKLLQVCQNTGELKRVVLTGGTDIISDDELGNGIWESVNSALKEAICKHVSKKAASKFMGFQKEDEFWGEEWKSTNIALKDAISKYISEKAALRFMRRQRVSTGKPMFQLVIIKYPVALGPILCEIAEANVELVTRRMEINPSGQSDICIPVCDVRDVAASHIKAMESPDKEKILVYYDLVKHRLSLKDMSAILKKEFKDHGDWDWDNVSQCLQDLQGNRTESNQDMDLGIKKSVIDMAHSCMERGFIPKMPGYRPRDQGRRYRDETTGATVVHGDDNTNVDGSEIN